MPYSIFKKESNSQTRRIFTTSNEEICNSKLLELQKNDPDVFFWIAKIPEDRKEFMKNVTTTHVQVKELLNKIRNALDRCEEDLDFAYDFLMEQSGQDLSEDEMNSAMIDRILNNHKHIFDTMRFFSDNEKKN